MCINFFQIEYNSEFEELYISKLAYYFSLGNSVICKL